jgi:hypothetical protein
MMKTVQLKGLDMLKMTAFWVISLLTLSAWAQAPASPSKATSSKAVQSKPAQANANANAKQNAVKTGPKPKTQRPTPLAPETPMGPDELAIADRVHQGHLPCELGASVRMEADASQPGYFYLHGKGFRYRMHPVATTTGAIRLEDRKAGAVWLQLANKSMLMDQNKGRRLADECANAEQVAFAEDMKTTPPPSLIDTTGMGR